MANAQPVAVGVVTGVPVSGVTAVSGVEMAQGMPVAQAVAMPLDTAGGQAGGGVYATAQGQVFTPTYATTGRFVSA